MTTNSTDTGSTTSAPSFLTVLRDDLRTRRAARAERRKLDRELATYRTPAERDDLAAMLDRYDDVDAAPVREALNRVNAA
ncbi:hypothetical protein [Kineosporia sp. R_H_3]|uniref:hypothetical protein n=1 Tax=Kineosporia sp. R_H_3 TaxID=1961848 RepID=UPI000B4B7E4C|nr:hypothetical protein [Kineosporia sp. R_H_3]